MRYRNPSISALLHLINRKIHDLHITNGRKSHGVIAHEKTDF